MVKLHHIFRFLHTDSFIKRYGVLISDQVYGDILSLMISIIFASKRKTENSRPGQERRFDYYIEMIRSLRRQP